MKKSSLMPLLPLVMAAGLIAVAPGALKRKMRPTGRLSAYTPGGLGLAGRSVFIDGPGGKRLHGWWIPVGHTAPAVVVLHGWGANASVMLPLARPLHAAGFHALFIDARGHGLSEHDGYASMPRFSEDLDAAVNWTLARKEVTGVGVIGHSIGAAAGILAAARDHGGRISCLVSVSAFAEVWDVMTESSRLGTMPPAASWAVRRTLEYVLGASLDTIAPVRHIKEIKVPIMIMHGDRDEVVGVQHAFRLAEAAPQVELRIVAGGTHGDLADFEARLGPVLDFLSGTLCPEVPSRPTSQTG